MTEPIRKKIKDLTKEEAERYFCDKYERCEICPLDRDRIGCKMDVFSRDYDEEEIELNA